MKIYKTNKDIVFQEGENYYSSAEKTLDALLCRDDLDAFIRAEIERLQPLLTNPFGGGASLTAPIGNQEVWAAGVTYDRSRDARMEEAQESGGGDCYDRVYSAERPELFFKASPGRVVGHRQIVRIRSDSACNVPEPELTLVVSSGGRIVGYTVGNDLTSRDIEGENPLYLPQAKIFDKGCSLGPGILVAEEPLDKATEIRMEVLREGAEAFAGETRLSNLTRPLASMVEYLFRENSFPYGCFLMTGTGIVPPKSFSLKPGDEIHITIEPIGTLVNTVEPVEAGEE